MAISAQLTVVPSAPNHGDIVTATYSVSGVDATAPSQATVSGEVVVAGEQFEVSTTITLPGAPAADVTYSVPTCPGLVFAATENPAVFTAVVP